MLKTAQIDYIKHLYENDGKSLREIAKIVGKNFRTVQKYAYMNNWSPKIEPNVEVENSGIGGAHTHHQRMAGEGYGGTAQAAAYG